MLCLLSCLCLHAQESASKEHKLKAAFIYNFPKFVQWPSQRFTSSNAPFVIGVVGHGPTITELQALAKERTVVGRPLEVKPVQTVDDAATVHLLLVNFGEEKVAQPILAAIRDTAVLTIGESDRFTSGGGMITLIRESDKIRFRINVESAKRAGLVISAQLLQLALPQEKKP